MLERLSDGVETVASRCYGLDAPDSTGAMMLQRAADHARTATGRCCDHGGAVLQCGCSPSR